MVSGSASAPILSESHESLAGRILGRRVLPFSYREYCLYHLHDDLAFEEILRRHAGFRERLLEGDAPGALSLVRSLDTELVRFTAALRRYATDYWRDGGFPEVWKQGDLERRQDFLWESVVKKAISEDLAPAGKTRKPENIQQLRASYLLSHPGIELNLSKIASDAGLKAPTGRGEPPALRADRPRAASPGNSGATRSGRTKETSSAMSWTCPSATQS